jgi:tight adherence protein C
VIKIKIIILALYIIIGFSIFLGSYYILTHIKYHKKKDGIKYAKINGLLRNRKEGYFSYERIYNYLKRNGNPLSLSPGGFIITKFISSMIIFVIFLSNPFLAVLLAFAGFYLIELIIFLDNRSEMKKIKIQLTDVYDFLNIQTSAGVFIGSALTEAYLMVKNKRLKRALAELCAEINLTKNINTALDKFEQNFNSVEIEAFTLTIKQSLITGKIEQALNDLSNSQKEMNLIIIQEQTESIKIYKDIIQVMMYVGILSMVFFGLITEISQGWSTIF